MKNYMITLVIICGVLTNQCFAEDVVSNQFKTIDMDKIPRLKGEEDNPPDIIFFSQPNMNSDIRDELTSKNHLDVYVAVWYRTGRIIWSDRSSKPSDFWKPSTVYYESYLERKQLDEFWSKYRDIKAWQHFGWGGTSWIGPACNLYVSAKWSRFSLLYKTEDYLYDSYLCATDFEWPTLKEYEKYMVSHDGMEAWLRLRHNVCLLIPHRPVNVRHREKVDVTFYLPGHPKEDNPNNSDLSVGERKLSNDRSTTLTNEESNTQTDQN